MAEVAGLVLGAAGIAGLIGTFKDTIDLFNLLVDARHMSEQLQILEIKLDIEKTLLLQWADRVRLLHTDYDKRLDNTHTFGLVIRIMAAIRSLLTNTNDLQNRYGLRDPSEPIITNVPSGATALTALELGVPAHLLTGELPTDDGANISTAQRVQPQEPQVAWKLSKARMEKFTRELADWHPFVEERPKTMSSSRKVRWVVRDKVKFESFTRELAHFTSKLNDILPPTAGAEKPSMRNEFAEDLSEVRNDIRQLRRLLDASVDQHHSIAESIHQTLNPHRYKPILDKLWFRRINDRKESIRDNHSQTLRWALASSDEADGRLYWDDLSRWLRAGSGIYWICGKAGSGKSTLMKYISTHPKTHDLVSYWASSNGGCYLPCDFFFSNLGSKEQKTREGLARTLLHQILSKTPSLIEDALPNMWKEVLILEDQITSVKALTAADQLTLPSTAEIAHAFKIISANSKTVGRCCFFIDGFDEFEGDCADGLTFLKSLAANESIKVVVSSRPIAPCVAAFRGLPRLQLHALTESDMSGYVGEVIGGHPSMRRHLRRFPEESAALLRELVLKSSGVWLWTILACRSVLGCFADHDRLSEIQRRVDELPRELEDMFRHMLSQVPDRHRQQGAEMLRICQAYHETTTPFLRKGLQALGLGLLEEEDFSLGMVKDLSEEDKTDVCEDLEGRLRSRCGGLLEFAANNGLPVPIASQVQDAKVVFMHRTVFEFLRHDDIWRLPFLQPRSDTFDAASALSLYGIYMATERVYAGMDVQGMDYFEEGLWWGALADNKGPGLTEHCFFHLGPFLDVLRDPPRPLISGTLQRIAMDMAYHNGAESLSACPSIPFRLGVEAGALNFVQSHPDMTLILKSDYRPCVQTRLDQGARLEGRVEKVVKSCQHVLYHTFRRKFLSSTFSRDRDKEGLWWLETLNMLIEAGCRQGSSDASFPGNGDVVWNSDMVSELLDEFECLKTWGISYREKHIMWRISVSCISSLNGGEGSAITPTQNISRRVESIFGQRLPAIGASLDVEYG